MSKAIQRNSSSGTGSDTLVLYIAQDALKGADTQFQVFVDGVQVGGVFATSALFRSSQADTLTLGGNWGSGAHDVSVRFLNDGRNTVTGEDRNLYLTGAAFNGAVVGGAKANLYGNGSSKFSTGADTLVIKVSQDAMKGADAQFQIFVDGVQQGGTFSTSALYRQGQTDTLTLSGNWGAGQHDVVVKYVNDGRNTATGEDRNLYVQSIALNEAILTGGNPNFYSGGSSTFRNGADTLVVKISQDAMKGADAQFQVFVDGVQQGGTFSTAALRKSGQSDTLTFSGNWVSGDHSVAIKYINDGRNAATGEDRNLYVEGISLNGATLTGADANMYSGGTRTFHTGADTLVLKISQDAMKGDDALFRVIVDGVQEGGTFSTAALHKSGRADTLTLSGNWGSGAHTVRVTFVNDARDTSTGEDRNLYVESATYNGAAVSGAKKSIVTGSGQFSIAAAPVTKPADIVTAPVETATPADTTGKDTVPAKTGFYSALETQMAMSGATNNWTIKGGSGEQRTGSDGNDAFYSIAGDTLIGGSGDDTYDLWDAKSLAVERVGGGIDTVFAHTWGNVTLADNIENLFLKGEGTFGGTGNALGNLIVAGAVGAMLDGRGGNDVLVGGAGADVFKVKAGNGSDAIVNFQSAWDVISLEGYGIDSFAKLLGRAQQTGADVTVNLSASETLVVRDLTLGKLTAADFNLPFTSSTAVDGAVTLDKAGSGWNANGWYVLNNAWGASNLTWGKDVSLTGQFQPSNMTDGTTFTWSTPLTTDPYRPVIMYPEVYFGISPWDTTGKNPTDTAHVFPVKVADLVSFTADHDISLSGTLSGFNVAYDIWLTSTPGGNSSTITNEVMIWVHDGDMNPYAPRIGTYTSPEGFTADIHHSGTYTAVIFDQDRPDAVIDIAHVLKALQATHIVSANEYIGAIELGAEVFSGVGSYTINDLDFSLTTRNADGSQTTKLIEGTGTTVTSEAASLATVDSVAGLELLSTSALDQVLGLTASAGSHFANLG